MKGQIAGWRAVTNSLKIISGIPVHKSTTVYKAGTRNGSDSQERNLPAL